MTTPPTGPASISSSDPPDEHPSRGVLLGSGLLALFSGTLTAVQSRANGTLAQVFGDPLDAALWSFGSGWVLLTLGLLTPQARGGLRRAYQAYRASDLRWWMFFGGLIGGTFVAIQSYAVPIAGIALFLIGIVAGQTVSALIVDKVGLGPGGPQPVTLARVAAAGVALVGVLVAVGGRVGAGGTGLVVPVVLAVSIGVGLAIQAATNGRVNRASGNVMATTWVNFTWGSVLLVGLAAGRRLFGTIAPPQSWAAPWWAFLGGIFGIIFVSVGSVVVHHLGVLLVMLLTLTGQLAGALVLDLINPATRAQVGLPVFLGVAITLTAALSAGFAANRAAQATRLAAGTPTQANPGSA